MMPTMICSDAGRRRSRAAALRAMAVSAAAALVLSGLAPAPATAAANCAANTVRTVEIDTSTGPLFGDLTKFAKQPSFLKPREVVLTFDDGPIPWITKSILDTLDQSCAKATFFSVGRMAVAYPAMVKTVLARGHTVGAHTYTHPMHLRTMRSDLAIGEIERGFAAVAAAAGQPIAPFFRFPGLGDSSNALLHLQRRGIATFTVDIVSNDSFIADPVRLARETLQKIEARHGGIILFHDIKASTARALPTILAELTARGYRIVHMTAKQPYVADSGRTAEFRGTLAKAEAEGGSTMVPFFGAAGPMRAANADAAVTAIEPDVKSYADKRGAGGAVQTGRTRHAAAGPAVIAADAVNEGWVTVVRRTRARTAKPGDGGD